MTGVEIYEFIKPHLGIVNATGSYSADMERLKYLEVRNELLNCLLEDLEYAYLTSKDSYEHSVQMINKACIDEMKQVLSMITDYLEDYYKENEEE